MSKYSLLFIFIFLVQFQTQAATIHNDVPRVDTDGNIIDCHSGNIIKVNQTYYMYGEHYGNSTGFGPSPPLLYPKVVVYTSQDFENWKFGGFTLNDWPTKPYGTFFTPWTVYNQKTQMFVMWFNAYMNGCCEGNWGVAQSKDGISFDLVSLNEMGKYPEVDGNGIWIEDDGTAYIIYTSINPGPGLSNHRVSIEKLSSDYLHTTGENYGLFPEDYVEGAILFKRNNLYYVTYGSCCCFCRGGSGLVAYNSPNITGPWKRQTNDLNCNQGTTGAPICGAYGDRIIGKINIEAQGIGLSILPTTDGNGFTYIWQGERWLSAANNNASCPDECQNCVEPDSYIKGEGYSYWAPLQFNSSTGEILPLDPFVNTFTVNLV